MLKCSRMMTSILGNPVYLRQNYDDDDDDDGDDVVGGDVHDDLKKCLSMPLLVLSPLH